jgi:hypothetical protein
MLPVARIPASDVRALKPTLTADGTISLMRLSAAKSGHLIQVSGALKTSGMATSTRLKSVGENRGVYRDASR